MSKKKNDGKKFEVLNRIIQEALKEKEDVEIISNYKIKNIHGKKREIDILINSVINGFPIKIAIECKDYKEKVKVGRLDEFASKCHQIPDINKKIFVSKNGFQAGAIDTAKTFGIDLYTLNEINNSTVLNWLNPNRIKKINITPSISSYNVVLTGNHDPGSLEPLIFHTDYPKPVNFFQWMIDFINSNLSPLHDIAILCFPKLKSLNANSLIIPYELKVKKVYFIQNTKKYFLDSLQVHLEFIFPEKEILDAEFLSFKSISKTTSDVELINIPIGHKGAKLTIVHKNQGNKLEFLISDKKGKKVLRLKKLASIDPSNDNINLYHL